MPSLGSGRSVTGATVAHCVTGGVDEPPQFPTAATGRSRRTRRLARVALVAGAATAAGTGGPKPPSMLTRASYGDLADPPNVQAPFSVNGGHRTCTVVNTYDESLGIITDDTAATPESDPVLGTVYYVAEWEYWTTIRYTQIYRQRAKATWDMTGGDEILDDWIEKRCYVVDDSDVRTLVG